MRGKQKLRKTKIVYMLKCFVRLPVRVRVRTLGSPV